MQLEDINLLRNFRKVPHRWEIYTIRGTAKGLGDTKPRGNFDPKATEPVSISFKGEILGYFQEHDVIMAFFKQWEHIGGRKVKAYQHVINKYCTFEEVAYQLSYRNIPNHTRKVTKKTTPIGRPATEIPTNLHELFRSKPGTKRLLWRSNGTIVDPKDKKLILGGFTTKQIIEAYHEQNNE